VRILLVLFVVAQLLETLGYVEVEFGFSVLVVELRLGELKVGWGSDLALGYSQLLAGLWTLSAAGPEGLFVF